MEIFVFEVCIPIFIMMKSIQRPIHALVDLTVCLVRALLSVLDFALQDSIALLDQQFRHKLLLELLHQHPDQFLLSTVIQDFSLLDLKVKHVLNALMVINVKVLELPGQLFVQLDFTDQVELQMFVKLVLKERFQLTEVLKIALNAMFVLKEEFATIMVFTISVFLHYVNQDMSAEKAQDKD